MKQIVYISFSADCFNEKEDIQKILAASQRNNLELELTGILLYRGGLFMQLLEGPEENIQYLLEKILRDRRHRNLKVLAETDGNGRLFKHWSMAYRYLEDSDLSKLNEILPWKEIIKRARDKEPIDNGAIMKIIRTFSLELGKKKEVA